MNSLIIIAIIALLQIADIITTVIGLKRGGEELNPLARKLFGMLGVIPAAILMKLLGTAPIVATIMLYPKYWWAGAVFAFFTLGVVINNLFSIRGPTE